jgi:hypothetical protein
MTGKDMNDPHEWGMSNAGCVHHVIPNKGRKHKSSTDCWCRPKITIRDVAGNWVVIDSPSNVPCVAQHWYWPKVPSCLPEFL